MITVQITKTTEGYEVQASGEQRIYCYPTIGKAQKMQRRLLDAVIDLPQASLAQTKKPPIPEDVLPLDPIPPITGIVTSTSSGTINTQDPVRSASLDGFIPGAIPNKAREEISEYDRSTGGSALQAQISARIQAIKAKRESAPADQQPGELRVKRQPEAV